MRPTSSDSSSNEATDTSSHDFAQTLDAYLATLGLIAETALASTRTPEQQLGRKIYLDTNLSLNRNQACETCHSPGPLPDRPSRPGVGDDRWPVPEISANVNEDEPGDRGPSFDEETAIIAFLKTLTDGYRDEPTPLVNSFPKSAAR